MINRRKQQILNTVYGVTMSMLTNDRLHDTQLPKGSIEEAIEFGLVSIDEMTSAFRSTLVKRMKEHKG